MILSIDQGTTGTTVLIFAQDGQIIGRGYQEISQYYPQAGWVEHDGKEIWDSCLQATKQALVDAAIDHSQLKAIGITNQRETTLVWDRRTGQPVHNAIVWQCRRSTDICQSLKQQGKADWIYQKTGLLIDAYFSASKLQWLFQQKPELLLRAKAGELAFGTIDSWLIWNLSNGQQHLTDHTNASRTLLYNIEDKAWDPELLALFKIPSAILPEIKNSADDYGVTKSSDFFELEIPISGVAGDQQAALFGQGCVKQGMLKNTYGTGCFMLMYAGTERPYSKKGLLTTIACDESGQPAYALEGAVFTAGAAVQWLRDELKIIDDAKQTSAIANSIADTQGVYLVPAFNGLGAPYWDMQARGVLVGLTRGVGRAEIIRATLEAIAFQATELAQLMSQELGHTIEQLKVDGGACANNFLMQFQANLINSTVIRPIQIESTAIGAALLAGIGAGIWQADQLPQACQQVERLFNSKIEPCSRQQLLAAWKTAIAQVQAGSNKQTEQQ